MKFLTHLNATCSLWQFTDRFGFSPPFCAVEQVPRQYLHGVCEHTAASSGGCFVCECRPPASHIHPPPEVEPHGADVVWGEGVISTCVPRCGFSLLRKGASVTLEEALSSEWRHWVCPQLPNARLVWRSMRPSLFSKSLWYARSGIDVVVNLRSLVWGLTFAGFPTAWWTPQFRRCWAKYRLSRLFALDQAHAHVDS